MAHSAGYLRAAQGLRSLTVDADLTEPSEHADPGARASAGRSPPARGLRTVLRSHPTIHTPRCYPAGCSLSDSPDARLAFVRDSVCMDQGFVTPEPTAAVPKQVVPDHAHVYRLSWRDTSRPTVPSVTIEARGALGMAPDHAETGKRASSNAGRESDAAGDPGPQRWPAEPDGEEARPWLTLRFTSACCSSRG